MLSNQDSYFFECPHCSMLIEIEKNMINCKIFRHGHYKNNLKQIDPHSSKEICDKLSEQDKIYGCGKPFTFDGKVVEKCGYI
jgi:uncharacterized C2H2 Zn-finger protein